MGNKRWNRNTSALWDAAQIWAVVEGRDWRTVNSANLHHNDAAEAIFYRALERGLSFKVTMGNVLTLTPPLVIAEGDLMRGLDILEACIGEVG